MSYNKETLYAIKLAIFNYTEVSDIKHIRMFMQEDKFKESILKKCQDFLSNPPVVVLGTGSSIELGMPGMARLQSLIQGHLSDIDIKEEDKNKLMEDINNFGLEAGLAKHTQIVDTEKILNRIIEVTWELIFENDTAIFKKIINDINPLPLQRFIARYKGKFPLINIITTNYDRLIEYAIDREKDFVLYRGFPNSFHSRFNTDERLKIEYLSNSTKLTQINLWKVHGSIDWFEENDVVVSFNPHYCCGHKKFIITPGLNKYSDSHKNPYREIIAKADSAINSSKNFFCAGYGFNDSHIQEYLELRLREQDVKMIVLAQDLTDSAKKVFFNHKNNAECVLIESGETLKDCRIYTDLKDDSSSIEIKNFPIWNISNFSKSVLGV